MVFPTFYNWLPLPSPTQNCPFPLGDLDPHLYMVPWARPSPQPKGRLDWFSCFAGVHSHDRQNGNNKLHSTVMRRNNVVGAWWQVLANNTRQPQAHSTRVLSKTKVSPVGFFASFALVNIIWITHRSCDIRNLLRTENNSSDRQRKQIWTTMTNNIGSIVSGQ